MKTIIVCQLDHLGYFVGLTEADESPLEPDIYHLPGGCVEIDPPNFDAEKQTARLVDGDWLIEEIPADPEEVLDGPGEDDQPLAAWQILDLRRQAYAVESDPLKFEAEYDAIINGTEPNYEGWLSKVAEIKERYPMPEEAAA